MKKDQVNSYPTMLHSLTTTWLMAAKIYQRNLRMIPVLEFRVVCGWSDEAGRWEMLNCRTHRVLITKNRKREHCVLSKRCQGAFLYQRSAALPKHTSQGTLPYSQKNPINERSVVGKRYSFRIIVYIFLRVELDAFISLEED